MDFLYLFGISGDPSTIIHDFKNWRGREHYQSLFICSWIIPCFIHLELDIPLLLWRILWFDCYCCRMCTNCFVLRLLLPLHHQSVERQRFKIACVVLMDPLKMGSFEMLLCQTFMSETWNKMLRANRKKINWLKKCCYIETTSKVKIPNTLFMLRPGFLGLALNF